jgi:hypothetical protein
MKNTVKYQIGISVLLLLSATVAQSQQIPSSEVKWPQFTISILAHGAANGFDAWTSWQHVERNGFLADNGRFTARSACKKASTFAAITLVQVAVLKKWGKQHPWLEKAFTIANFSSAGMYAGAGMRNLQVR